VDPTARRVTLASGQTVQGDFLVLAAGSQPNFFATPGAEHSYPLYSLEDAQRLRSRILALFEAADRDPSLLDRGALNFLIVGAGPTGVETAGALADLINKVMPYEYRDLAVQQARVILVELTGTVLPPYTEKLRTYAAEVLQRRGVELRLNTSIKEIHTDRVLLSDDTTIPTLCVIWSGGLKAAPLAASSRFTQGRGGRIDVQPDLRVPGHPGVYPVGPEKASRRIPVEPKRQVGRSRVPVPPRAPDTSSSGSPEPAGRTGRSCVVRGGLAAFCNVSGTKRPLGHARVCTADYGRPVDRPAPLLSCSRNRDIPVRTGGRGAGASWIDPPLRRPGGARRPVVHRRRGADVRVRRAERRR
jgi:hypothetical protein